MENWNIIDTSKEVEGLIGQHESEELEYKAILPPSRTMAQIIASFANTNGGFLILGVTETSAGVIVNGLSEDFYADAVLIKALDRLTPKPEIRSQYVIRDGKRVFAIKVKKSVVPVFIEGKYYVRIGDATYLHNPPVKEFKAKGYEEIKKLHEKIESYRKSGSGSKSNLIDHYQSVLNIMDDLGNMLYPVSPEIPTDSPEGKVLMRILFSSCADNFEVYLSDLLFEIYLGNPSTLKSGQQVTVREVLDCVDLQEFITVAAKKKLEKLQRGSVTGFIKDNKEIGGLNSMDETQQLEIEKILQIRHLYSHKNGNIDEKFLTFFPGVFKKNEEHRLSIEEALKAIKYVADTVDRIDKAAVAKYSLATLD